MSEVKWSGGIEHWTKKGDIRLFLWQRKASAKVPPADATTCLTIASPSPVPREARERSAR